MVRGCCWPGCRCRGWWSGRARSRSSRSRPRAGTSPTSTATSYVDLCLGDTGAMGGHSPAARGRGGRRAGGRGFTLMLPTEDSAWVGEELGRRFGLPRWQFALTATDANRFSLRLARAISGRPKVLVYAWCYHGTVDESLAIEVRGETRSRPNSIGPPVDPALTTRAVEWNDIEALERALAPGDVACVLAEPAMTNAGIRPPRPGLPRRAAGPHPRTRDAADHRRDPLLLRRARRIHGRPRPRARHAHHRQGDRERDPRCRLRDDGRGRRQGGHVPALARGHRRRRNRRDPGRERPRWRRRGQPWTGC